MNGQRQPDIPLVAFSKKFSAIHIRPKYQGGWRKFGSGGLVGDCLAGGNAGNGRLGAGSNARGKRKILEFGG
jgi:ABC-type taurine transport system substrate-binding protein